MLGTSQTLNRGRYQIISSFSQDATGALYEALDTVNNTPVLLRESVGSSGKVATPSQIEAINAAFAGEAMVLAEIDHESLVSVYDYFSEIDRQYLVLESVTGENLTKYLEPATARPSTKDVLSWADQLLNGLQYLHRLTPAIIHSNVTPENIKLTSNLKIKLLTTKVSGPTRTNGNAATQEQITEDPAFRYKPLEQLWKDLNYVSQRVIVNSYDERSASVLLRPLDARSDLYSAAASLYHVLAGVPPCDALERSIAILDGNPDPLRKLCEINEDVPPEVSDAIMRALSIRRENRFDSAMIMQQVLKTSVIKAAERAAGISNDQSVAFDSKEAAAGVDQLELESKRADEREREIHAEQARLDEEQKRIEQRKLELEAERERQAAERERLKQEAENEQKRLIREKLEHEAELERQRVAQRLADLEAESAREREEAERLELEAQEERRRAEEKLEALKQEQELHRAEQKRIELEARKELEQAEERIKELSFFDLKIEKEPDTNAETGAPNPFDVPEPVETQQYQTDDMLVPNFGQQSVNSSKMPAMVGGIAALVVISGGIWFAMSSGTPEQTPKQATVEVPVIEQQVQVPEPVTAAPEQPGVESPTSPTETAPTVETQPDPQKRVQTAAVIQKKAAAPEKTAPAKKKVTVDDLINDN